MNNRQKLVQQRFLDNEQAVIDKLYDTYYKSLQDVTAKAKKLQFKIDQLQHEYDWSDLDDPTKAKIKSIIQSKIYQRQYQEQLQTQLEGIVDQMRVGQYTTVADYLDECYTDGFIGTMFDVHGQGVHIVMPIDQEAMVRAVQLESKISKGLYTKLGEDLDELKRRITAEVSRGISTGMSFAQTAKQISNQSRIGYNRAIRIARTEGHRIQTAATMDAAKTAKDNGCDVVKQWDAALDKRTRPSHARVDGEIREIDEPFSNGLMYPGDPSGSPGEVINCRCALLQRARWALDDDELETLRQRASYYGLDKADTFDDFKKKYLEAVDTAKKVSSEEHKPISERSKPVVKSPEEFDKYVEEHGLKKIYRGYSAESDEQLAEYVESYKLGTVPESGEKSSALGKGVYFADDKSEAEGYMYRRRGEKSQSKGKVTTAALDVDAKVGNYNELRQQKFDAESACMQKAFAAQGNGDQAGFDKWKDEYYKIANESFEDYLRDLGYDALYDPATGYTIVIRQKALVIRDD